MNVRSDGFSFGEGAEPLASNEAERLLQRISSALRKRPAEAEPVPEPLDVDIETAMAAIAKKMARKQ